MKISLAMLQCENMGSCMSNHTGILGQVHSKNELEATASAKMKRTKYEIEIGRAQK